MTEITYRKKRSFWCMVLQVLVCDLLGPLLLACGEAHIMKEACTEAKPLTSRPGNIRG
jgi:hypothetical protein